MNCKLAFMHVEEVADTMPSTMPEICRLYQSCILLTGNGQK
jgi:hypothetical protein